MNFRKICPLCKTDLFYDNGILCNNVDCPFQGPTGMNEEESWKNWQDVIDALRNNALEDAGIQTPRHRIFFQGGEHAYSFFFNYSEDGQSLHFCIAETEEHFDISVEAWLSQIEAHFPEGHPHKKLRAVKEFRNHAHGVNLTTPGLKASKNIVDGHDAVTAMIYRRRSEAKVAPPDRSGWCRNCSDCIKDPKTFEMIGCQLTTYPNRGNDCPLAKGE